MVKTASPKITQCTEDFSSLLNLMRESGTSKGMTSYEIAEAWGVSQATAQKRLRRAAAMGLIRSTRKEMDFMDGRRASVPSYVMEPRQ